jgi:energy-coupling factor transporter ATP-binding protein EcfA2
MSYVIALAGPIGSGKSSLVRALVNQLHDASMLYFDHYENITRKPPHELVKWIHSGADIDMFTIPGLVRDLEKLKQGEPVADPVTNEMVAPRKYIVFEMPFGKAHAATAPYIDLLLWIDLPLDVALARKVREHTGMFLERCHPDKHQECLAWLHGYLDSYLIFVHDILVIQHDKVRPQADLLLDGTSDLESMSQRISLFIRTKLP